MWGVSRSLLDGYLLDAARAAGATIVQPARCESLETEGDGGATAPPLLRVRDLSDNTTHTLRPSFVLVADGKSALLGPGHATPPPTGDFGIKAHFVNVAGPRDTIELFAARRRYGGLAAIEGGRWNAAFAVSGESLRRHRGDVEALFREVVAENPTLAGRLKQAERVGRWLAAPLPRFAVRDEWPDRVIPIGNAAAALEPIGGEGMGLAMRSAELAAEALDASLDTSRPRLSLMRAYRRLWRTRRVACRAAAVGVSSPLLAGVLRVFGPDPPAAGTILRLIGKS
jgi:2-polyprenyl-6-methoxyphenol hydroxylase-like FAD-dependent oxidoreductase